MSTPPSSSSPSSGSASAPQGGKTSASRTASGGVDIERLAQKVYELMKRDLNLQGRRAGGGR